MTRFLICLTIVASVVVALMPKTREEYLAMVCPKGLADCDETSAKRAVSGLLREIQSSTLSSSSTSGGPYPGGMPARGSLAYWRFIPELKGHALPGGPALSFSTPCYETVTVSVSKDLIENQFVEINMNFGTQTLEPLCEMRLWMTVGAIDETFTFQWNGSHTRVLNVSGITPAGLDDFGANGVRVFLHQDTQDCQIDDVLSTLLLFVPELTNKLDPVSLQNNNLFFNRFTQLQPGFQPRSGAVVPLNFSEVHSGDCIFQASFDGMGPAIGLGTGSTANHVGIFLTDPASGMLNLCESNANGVICTPGEQWMEDAVWSSSSTVFAPLSAEASSTFDNNAAWAWTQEQLGLEYGYQTFFFGWIDTPQENWPCFPPDFKVCLRWEHVEWVGLRLTELSPAMVAEYGGQGLNHRAGTSGLPLLELLQYARNNLNMTGAQLMAVPEQDSWRYNTTKYGEPVVGRSMVCSTLVCHIMREAGLFAAIDGDLECGEQTPFDIASLNFFDSSKFGVNRPPDCVAADPANPLCQLAGYSTFILGPDMNTRTPYRQMSNTCPSQNPGYARNLSSC